MGEKELQLLSRLYHVLIVDLSPKKCNLEVSGEKLGDGWEKKWKLCRGRNGLASQGRLPQNAGLDGPTIRSDCGADDKDPRARRVLGNLKRSN